MVRLFIILFFIFINYNVSYSQSTFCSNSNGQILFYENFGIGNGFGDPLSPGTTTYNYTTNYPSEGEYTLYSNTFPGVINLPGPDEQLLWHLYSENPGEGKMLLVNANSSPGTFYQKKIYGLCGNSSYEFSLTVAPLYNTRSNICANNGSNGAPINFKVQIWDISQTTLIHEFESGNIQNTNIFRESGAGFLFSTLPNQTDILLKIINNNNMPGCGNDILIDDIRIKTCGSDALVYSNEYPGDEVSFCERELPVDITLNLNYSGASSDSKRWQKSIDGGNNWIDLWGEDSNTLIANGITENTLFRVKIAQSLINLNSSNCYWVSNVFSVKAYTIAPPVKWWDPVGCGNSPIPPLVVFPVPGVTVDWYDSPVGGNLLFSGSISYTPPGPGTYYAQARALNSSCFQSVRTAITLTWEPGVELPPNPDPVAICGGQTVVLDAGLANATYDWDPDIGSTQQVTINEPGTYTVTVSNDSDCVASRIFVITGYTAPQIIAVTEIDERTISVTMSDNNYYEFSIDNINWQTSNVFYNVSPGIVTIYVRDEIHCGYDSLDYLLLNVPNFFTPNGDGINDYFTIKGIENFNLEVIVFDRFGKLITILNSDNNSWDGTLNGQILPSTDYWYRASINNEVVKLGHMSIKR